MNRLTLILSLKLLILSSVTIAKEEIDIDACLLEKIKEADGKTLVSQIKAECVAENIEVQKRTGAMSNRIVKEKATAFSPYVITPHKMNYILPITFTDSLYKYPYEQVEQWSENLSDIEAKFQLSIKVPLNYNDIFIRGDSLYFGMTLESWWQVYADNISKPFRETNYQPEIFYVAPLNWHPFGSNTGFLIGAEHQSNGRSQLLSRSWNRAYAGLLLETKNFAMQLKPWWRLSEDEKETPLSATGDDNPDIDDYLGHFELSMAYQFDSLEFFMIGRQNFATHNGGLKVGSTFPLWGRLKGFRANFHYWYNLTLILSHN